MKPLLRVLLFYVLASKENGMFDHIEYSFVNIGISAWQIPFCMMALFFIVHFPSLNMSSSCDKKCSFALAEHIVYHTVLHSLVLSLTETVVIMGRFTNGDAYTWNAAAYLSLYYACRIYVASNAAKRCTLSPFILSAFMMLCVPFVVVASPKKATFVPCSHLFAWMVADITSAMHPPFKTKTFEKV
jgi:hypothetical protein